MGFSERYEATLADLSKCCQACGRSVGHVRVMAVSKTVGPDAVEEAVKAGAHLFGENRPEGIMQKSQLFPQEEWHFIGNIQSRRIADIVPHAALIHSLYQESHACKINDVAARLGKVQDVLLEVNVSGEESKSGLAPDQVKDMVLLVGSLPNVRLRGLMTMAPQGDRSAVVSTFEGLARLHAELKAGLDVESAACFNELSMGMSEDWPEAVAAGATIIRIGRALFSDEF